MVPDVDLTGDVGGLDLFDDFLGDYPAAGTALNAANGWTKVETLGLGVTASDQPNGVLKFAFDAVAEAATAALYMANAPFDIDQNPIFECRLAVYDIGDNAALDINFGLAVDTHATDFDSIAQYAAFHLDGTDLSVKCQTEDGTTTVAATDTTIDLVDDTCPTTGRFDAVSIRFCGATILVRSSRSCSIGGAAVLVVANAVSYRCVLAPSKLEPLLHGFLHALQTAAAHRVRVFAAATRPLHRCLDAVQHRRLARPTNLIVGFLNAVVEAVAQRARRIGLLQAEPNREVGPTESGGVTRAEVDRVAFGRQTDMVRLVPDVRPVFGAQQAFERHTLDLPSVVPTLRATRHPCSSDATRVRSV